MQLLFQICQYVTPTLPPFMDTSLVFPEGVCHLAGLGFSHSLLLVRRFLFESGCLACSDLRFVL
jgi:hypothetical protein